MKQWSVADKPAATLLAVGDPDNPVPTLIQNVDPLNTLYVGNDVGINPSNPLTCAPLPAGQSVVSDGSQNVFGIAAAGQTVAVNTYRGMNSFFLPASLSNLGGAAVFVQPTAPSGTGIPVNSLWFNTANQSMLVWSGTAWVQQQFSGSQLIVAATILSAQIANSAITTAKIATGAVGAAQVASGSLTSAQIAAAAGILGTQIANATITSGNIAANTIVAGNIAANTITGAQLAAGIVYAGIVDATTVQAAQYIGTNSQGQALFYSGTTPAHGTLVNAIAGGAGTDAYTNNYPAGFFGQQLTLADQTVSPPAFTGSSILYCIGGRLRCRGSNTVDMVVDRSAVNGNNFSMSTQTLPTLMSGALNYIANEAQQASEYEIEIDGTFTTPATTTATFTFDLFSDGAALAAGTSVTIGSVVTQTSKTYAYCVRFRIYLNSTGVNGAATVSCDGGINIKGANAGNTSTFASLQNTATGFTWNTTVNHTLAIYCNWSSTTGTGHSAITYRTKIVRRN